MTTDQRGASVSGWQPPCPTVQYQRLLGRVGLNHVLSIKRLIAPVGDEQDVRESTRSAHDLPGFEAFRLGEAQLHACDRATPLSLHLDHLPAIISDQLLELSDEPRLYCPGR